jgi:hypothetical protein
MKFRAWISTNKIGSECETEFEIDDAELAEMSSDEERDRYIEETAREAAFNHIEWSWEPL